MKITSKVQNEKLNVGDEVTLNSMWVEKGVLVVNVTTPDGKRVIIDKELLDFEE